MSAKSPWFIRADAANHPRERLFIFPHGGGSPAQYRDWGARLGAHAEVYIASLPGRGSRFRDEPIADMGYLIERLHAEISPLLNERSIFFGHSLGALVAFELTTSLAAHSQGTPKKLIVSAKNAPHLPAVGSPLSHLEDDAFVQALQQYDGTPAKVLEDKELMALYLPMLRADFRLSENYLCRNIHTLPCKLHIFGAQDDPFTTVDGLRQWSRYADGGCGSMMFEGGHFYFHAQQEKFFPALTQAFDT